MVLDLIKLIVSVHPFKGNFAAVVPAYHTQKKVGTFRFDDSNMSQKQSCLPLFSFPFTFNNST